MIALDSAVDRPTPEVCAQALAAGVGAWFGYLATSQAAGAFNLLSPWDLASFQVVQASGLQAGAFCSGHDDPATLAELARSWGLARVLLDVEDGIRGDGPWVDGWLATSGFGLYGLLAVQYHAAPYRVAALYPAQGCQGGSWPVTPEPAEAHGWQCQGTHTEFGLSVDRSVLSPDFFPGARPVGAGRWGVAESAWPAPARGAWGAAVVSSSGPGR